MNLQNSVLDWTNSDVSSWLQTNGFHNLTHHFHSEDIDGKALLLLTENDLKSFVKFQKIGDIKRLVISIRRLQLENQSALISLGYDPGIFLQLSGSSLNPALINSNIFNKNEVLNDGYSFSDYDHGVSSRYTPPLSEDGRSTKLKPEVSKALISLAYLFVVTWITAFVMVVVHDRVPDMKKYPPLPDIFLDNVPYIPWAFDMCEWTGSLLLFIWIMVLGFHKFRFILVRRFFALSGTVFLLRCVTMLITSLSVPGTHLQCAPREPDLSQYANHSQLRAKIYEAYLIWKGAGMSIQGVRTCGDYMFSGHTVALTMLNFFITEYTPRHFYFLHTFSWLLNMFGIFFILSGHEHYSIDVFVAFYITSRLFLYYHTLANNQALMQRDSNRTRIWFPLFSFFESSIDGIVPNEYESPLVHLKRLYLCLKNCCNRYSFLHLTNRQLNSFSRHMCHENNSNENSEEQKEKES